MGRIKVPVLDFTCRTHQQVQGSKRCGAGSLDNNLGTSLSMRKIYLRITLIVKKYTKALRVVEPHCVSVRYTNMEVKQNDVAIS